MSSNKWESLVNNRSTRGLHKGTQVQQAHLRKPVSFLGTSLGLDSSSLDSYFNDESLFAMPVAVCYSRPFRRMPVRKAVIDYLCFLFLFFI